MYKHDPVREKTRKGWQRTSGWLWTGSLIAGLLLVVFMWGQNAAAVPAAPGSEGDPLVTESWVKAFFSQTLQSLEGRLQKLEAGGVAKPLPQEPGPIPGGDSPLQATFEIVTVAAGEKLLAGSGTEIILRSGRARALAGPGGGLSDLTAGRNLAAGAPVQADHLLLSSRDDGRGITLESQAIFLVRGEYKVE